ncbi:MAG: hypothetical protein QM688_12715 [Sphingomonas bacterium]
MADAGFRTLEASNGDEAREVIDCVRDSIVRLFADVQMSGSMDGFALARHVAGCRPEIESLPRVAW